jgi:hypothetical protein
MSKPLVALALVLMAGAAGGCNKNGDEAGKPASVPPLDPAGAPTPAAAPVPMAAAPADPPAPPPADPNATISGEMVLPASIAKTKPSGTLYLVARRLSDNPTARGTLIAVKKMPATKFPLPFSLSASDMPFQNGPFDGDLTLTARIDQDGDPMTHQKGDVFGTLPKVRVGSRDVKLALDQIQKEAESLAGGVGTGAGGPMMGSGAGLPPGHP